MPYPDTTGLFGAFSGKIRSVRTVNDNSTQFGEDLSASRKPINQLNSSYGFTGLRYIREQVNGATVVSGTGTIDMATGTSASAVGSIQAAEIGRYSTGYGAQVGNNFIPLSLPTGDAVFTWGAEGEAGLNGLWFGLDSTGLYVEVYRGGTTREKTYQSDWNLDRLDGNGVSGVNINSLIGAIYQIEFTWYGNGEILFGVVRQTQDYTGHRKQRFIPCHQYVPSDGEVSINTPNLRNFCRIDNGTTGINYQARVGGMQYSIIGEFIAKPRPSAHWRGSISTDTTFKPLVAAKRKTGFGDRSIKLGKVELIAGNSPHLFQVRVGSSINSTNFIAPESHPTDETALEYCIDATTVTGGIPIANGLVPSSSPASQTGGGTIESIDVPNGDIVVLCARTSTGTSTMALSILEMFEEW